MNITENKLIAEFMGFQETKIGYYDYEEVLTLLYTFGNTFDYLLFDKSWDWLMPVLERIEDMGYNFDIDINWATISDQTDREGFKIIQFSLENKKEIYLPGSSRIY